MNRHATVFFHWLLFFKKVLSGSSEVWTPYLNSLPSQCMTELWKEFHLTALQFEERYLCYQNFKSNLTFWSTLILLTVTVMW